uniref:Homeobox domain-containing protein n=1 Tax=Acrobeloides nanus TaxID=290746 RepID=A0A914EPI4_9BILA
RSDYSDDAEEHMPLITNLPPGIAPLKRRRKRTNLDNEQKAALDACFIENCRPDHTQMSEIAHKLNLDHDVVRVWFCNRRQKLRKE